MAKLYGESIPEYVKKQIEVREKALGRKGNRELSDLQYISQKTGWVRMISGVNLENIDSYSPEPSKAFILAGGTMKWDGTKFSFRDESIDFSEASLGRYSLTENLGVRPEPGITSFDLKFKNRFGAIREANVSFNVWSKEDLSLAQDLFMRPGGQVIIEWGNSMYLDKDGNVLDSSFETSIIENYFENISIEDMYEYMSVNKEKTYGNMDGFLGLVTNFNWKVREDGGYDCSIKAVSRGALLESLTMIKSIDNKLINESILKDLQGKLEDKTDELSSSAISLLHYFIYLVNKKDRKRDREVITLGDLEKISLGFLSQLFTGLKLTGIRNLIKELSNLELSDDSLSVITTTIKDSDDRVCKYISLRTLLFLVNCSISVSEFTDFSLPKFYIGYLDPEQEEIDPPTYRTFPLHISVNPLVTILPKSHPDGSTIVDLVDDKTNISNIYYDSPIRVGTENIPTSSPFDVFDGINISSNIRRQLGTKEVELPKDRIEKFNTKEKIAREYSSLDILNIHVNLNVVEDILMQSTSSEEDSEITKLNVFDFLKKVLNRINNSLGGINSLDISFDEERQLYFIVDRSIVKTELFKKEDIVTLSESGLSSTVHSLDVSSKITSQLSSMIAISAQADTMRDSQADSAFIDWTRGGKNRFYLPSSDRRIESTEDEEESCEEKVRKMGIPKYKHKPYVGNRLNVEYTNELTKEFAKKLKECLEEKNRKDNPITYFLIDLSQAYDALNTEDYDTIKEKFNKVRIRANFIYKKLMHPEQQELSENDEVGTQGIIPIELSMTIDGISGMKIGQIFRLGNQNTPSILTPSKYDDYGFIITGLDTKIDTNNKWVTNIRAQTFKIGDLQ